MSYALYGIFYRMGKIVHRVYAPFVSRIVMRSVSDPVYYRVSHVYVRRGHIYLSSQHFLAVGIFARLHFFKEAEIFLYASVSVRAFFSRFFKSASVFSYFIAAKITDEGFPLLYQRYGSFVHLIEIIRSPQSLIPLKSQPLYIFFYGIHIFHIFFDRIGIVISEIALSAVFSGSRKV